VAPEVAGSIPVCRPILIPVFTGIFFAHKFTEKA
jgi:hypothetical protein